MFLSFEHVNFYHCFEFRALYFGFLPVQQGFLSKVKYGGEFSRTPLILTVCIFHPSAGHDQAAIKVGDAKWHFLAEALGG